MQKKDMKIKIAETNGPVPNPFRIAAISSHMDSKHPLFGGPSAILFEK